MFIGLIGSLRLLSHRLAAFVFLLSFVLMPADAAADPVQVIVSGIGGEVLENVEGALVLPPGLVRNGEVDRRWLERFRQQIPQRVRRAMEPFGYYEPRVGVTAEEMRDRVVLRVGVEPGRAVRIREMRVELAGEGAGRASLHELVDYFPLRPGDVLRHDLYEEGKGALQARATDLGYMRARFTEHVVRVYREEGFADIDLVFDTGARHFFGEISIEGGEIYPSRYLRRFLAFKTGDVFSYARLGETQFHFLDSDRFRDVIITPREEDAVDHHVPVDIQLTSLLPKRLRPGVGYATDTGARVTLRYQDVNVWRRGHELEAQALVAELKHSFGAAYIIPSLRNINTQTAFRVGYDVEDIDTYDRRTLFAEVERARAFSGDRRGAVYLRLMQESFTAGEDRDVTRLVLPGLRFSQRRYGTARRPQRGYSFSVETRGTHQYIGSDTNLLQFLGAGSALFAVTERYSVFFRFQGGTTLQDDPFSQVPVSLRFYAGGDQSVRGYAYNSLGPLDAEGRVLGGQHLLVGSVELERAFLQNWGTAVFYDAGNAFNDFGAITLRQGVGVGVRWYTPVGPIRFDVARQMAVEDPSYRLHLSMGFGW